MVGTGDNSEWKHKTAPLYMQFSNSGEQTKQFPYQSPHIGEWLIWAARIYGLFLNLKILVQCKKGWVTPPNPVSL